MVRKERCHVPLPRQSLMRPIHLVPSCYVGAGVIAPSFPGRRPRAGEQKVEVSGGRHQEEGVRVCSHRSHGGVRGV